MRLTFLGSGDAFGSGGRLNSCFLLEGPAGTLLIECGASAMVSLRRFAVDPNRIGAIFVSHLHADHFGGLPSFILDGQFVSRRTAPLVVCGPQGLGIRLAALMEAHFPGSTESERDFRVEVVELEAGLATEVPAVGVRVTAAEVVHPSGTPALALRLETRGRTVAYTGDTEWTDALLGVCRGADLLIAECYQFDRPVRYHLSYTTLKEKLPLLAARQTVLTHMSSAMLDRRDAVSGVLLAEDGLEIAL